MGKILLMLTLILAVVLLNDGVSAATAPSDWPEQYKRIAYAFKLSSECALQHTPIAVFQQTLSFYQIQAGNQHVIDQTNALYNGWNMDIYKLLKSSNFTLGEAITSTVELFQRYNQKFIDVVEQNPGSWISISPRFGASYWDMFGMILDSYGECLPSKTCFMVFCI